MSSLQQFIMIDHPGPVFNVAAFLLGLLSLTKTPPFWPLVMLISSSQLYIQNFHKRPHSGSKIFCLWLSISLAGTVTNLAPALHALSSSTSSLLMMACMSLIESGVSLIIVIADARVIGQNINPWAKTLLFPTLYASVWSGISHLSPLGRLIMWSPTEGVGRLSWLLPITGPCIFDWTVAACAVLLTQIVSHWLMGPNIDDPPKTSSSNNQYTLTLASFLAVLTLPSFVMNNVPLPPSSLSTTPLTVGCVLPSTIYDKRKPTELAEFIEVSKKMTNAHILIWPEGAVRFDNAQQKKEAFKQVSNNMSGTYVGVSFDEFVPDESGGRTGKRRNGFALIAPLNKSDSIAEFEYYKRHLVPVAESFATAPSDNPPPLYTLHLPSPKGRAPTKWSPLPNHTRPISLTSSICLDFASPSPFSALDSRPALILAPGRTWHEGVGLKMWEQAKSRAEEIGSTVLWCDGGEGGVSGVAGGGIGEFMQAGEGSWTRTIGIQWPFDDGRTAYAQGGDKYSIVFFWLLLGCGWVAGVMASRDLRLRPVVSGWRKVTQLVDNWKGNRRVAPVEEGDLLGIND